MKDKMKYLFILGGISIALLVFCGLLLSDIIKLPGKAAPEDVVQADVQSPAPNVPATQEPTTTEDPALVAAANEAYSKTRGYEEQVDNYFKGMAERNPNLLLGLYHPVYWAAGGQTTAAALEMMQDNVNELELPAGLTWEILDTRPPTDEQRNQIISTYEQYGLDVPISEIITLTVDTVPALNENTEESAHQLNFMLIEGSWYMFEDIFQMFY